MFLGNQNATEKIVTNQIFWRRFGSSKITAGIQITKQVNANQNFVCSWMEIVK